MTDNPIVKQWREQLCAHFRATGEIDQRLRALLQAFADGGKPSELEQGTESAGVPPAPPVEVGRGAGVRPVSVRQGRAHVVGLGAVTGRVQRGDHRAEQPLVTAGDDRVRGAGRGDGTSATIGSKAWLRELRQRNHDTMRRNRDARTV